jgi:pimeloyl-ACP methyl ester carboxylesterase
VGQAQTTQAPDGRTLCYAEFGDLGGHPVISLHGTPGCRLLSAKAIRLDFEALLRSLGVRLIRYDRPGYGGSSRHPGRSVADSAADVEAVADAVGVARFAVEGGSGGSPHALAAAALLPERVERVALVAPLAPGLLPAGEDEQALLHRYAREDAEMREQAAVDPDAAAVFEATRQGLWGCVDDELGWLRDWGFDVAEVGQRVQVWYGAGDTVLPAEHAQWLTQHLPNADLRESAALGHGSEADPRADWAELYRWLAVG